MKKSMDQGKKRVSSDEQAELHKLMDQDEQPDTSPDKLAVIVDTAHRLQEAQRKVARIQADLKQASDEVERLEFAVLPGLMDEVRLKDFTLEDGVKIIRDEAVYASLSKENAPLACAWLIKHGYGDIVKAAFTIPVPKGPEAPTAWKKINILLTKAKLKFDFAQGVHPQTLLAFVKESLKESRALPPTISVHQKPRAQLKEPKK